MDDRERRIRDRAYEIWEREGRPPGKEREHWRRAERELDDERGPAIGETTVGSSPTADNALPDASGAAPEDTAGTGKAVRRASANTPGAKKTAAAKKPTAAARKKPAGAKERPAGTKRKKKDE